MSFHGSYDPDDVTFLLKPVALAPTPIAEREALIQSGRAHYSETLAPESIPDAEYLALFDAALERNRRRMALDVVRVARAIRASFARPVLCSLARAGTPIGVLLRRALLRLGCDAPHYSVSIIRDRGLDENAMRHVATAHPRRTVVFVDGWTGKGAIATELRRHTDAPLAVLADPAGVADIAATGTDYLIPSGILNAIVSGLVSRTILSEALVGEDDFHACVYYADFEPADRSRAFVDAIEQDVVAVLADSRGDHTETGSRADTAAFVRGLMARCETTDWHRIKPGIAEATRSLLRRVPERLFLRDASEPDVAHLVHLAKKRGVSIEPLNDARYGAVALIRPLGNG